MKCASTLDVLNQRSSRRLTELICANVPPGQRPGLLVIPRTLRYPYNWPQEKAEEKGIDVALAVDFVAGAIEGTYDVGIICSTDTDLRPALEYVTHKFPDYPRAEVMAWKSQSSNKPIFIHASRRIWCHHLDINDYQAVEDLTDYRMP